MTEEIDTSFVDSLGVSATTLFPTQGLLCAEKMPAILSALAPSSSISSATRAAVAEGFNLWGVCCEVGLRTKVISQYMTELYDGIACLAMVQDPSADSEEYKGAVFCANKLAATLSTVGSMDATQALATQFAPLAYAALEKILAAQLSFAAKTIMQPKDTPSTCRTELCCALLKTLPYSGSVDMPNGMKVLSTILLDATINDTLKMEAKAALSTMTNVSKASIAHAGVEIIALVKAGGNDQLLMSYLSMPELYTNQPDAVHINLALFFAQPYMYYSGLFYRIAQLHPAALLGYVDNFVAQLALSPNMGTMTLLVLEGIATVNPDAVYAHLDTIVKDGKSIAQGGGILAKLLGRLASASVANAAEHILMVLVQLLDADASAAASVLLEVSNMMKLLPDRELLRKHLPSISKHKAASEVAYTAIEDFAAGRSLETLTLRVDDLDAQIKKLNQKVSETCTNMADVIAYVDANMADMKDFLAEVVKKLPSPKRLEVVGTLRKTLILHFECVHTGYEYPITSHEWSKWLKMGFSLVKAGQAVIDLGMGNPLGIVKKGVECVQEIYESYKTNDDDEFNTYITNPFLTSSEQDQLLEKLRAQAFFELFAYDSQLAGWYLLHPEKDGKAAAGEQGSVTKVWRKEGQGVTESLTAAAQDALGMVAGEELVKAAMDAADGVAAAISEAKQDPPMVADSKGSDKAAVPSPAPARTAAASGAAGGGRAAAMREQFGPAANNSADDRIVEANRSAVYYSKMDAMDAKMQELEAKVRLLTTEVNHLKGNQPSCACIIQ